MPPKRVSKAKLHQLAVELPLKTVISDLSTKKQFCVGRQFATGGFGRIYTCNEVGSKTELVVKVEPYGNGPLFTELNVFMRIFKPDQIAQFMRERKLKRLGVPTMISGGIHQHGNEKLRFLVLPKYATSLEAIREKRKTFPQSEVWTIARCMMESLEYIHSKNYTHADIKAANILLEKADDFSTSVLADYGLARMSSSNEDKPDKKRAHNGTAIFTSCDAHRGCHPSYRGDLEILAYNMVYWLTGSLPWEANESSPDKVYQMKETFLKGLPSSLNKLLKDCAESVIPLKEIFAIAQKTGYSNYLDFTKLYKIADDVLKRSVPSRSTSKRKNAEEIVDSDEGLPMKPKRAEGVQNAHVDKEVDSPVRARTKGKRKNAEKIVDPKEALPVKRKRAEDVQNAHVDKEVDSPASSLTDRFKASVSNTPVQSPKRHVRLKTATKSEIRVLGRTRSPRPSKASPTTDSCSFSSTPQLSALPKRSYLLELIEWMKYLCTRLFLWQMSADLSPSDRDNLRASRMSSTIVRKPPRLSAGGIVPGLLVRRAPCSPLNAKRSSSGTKDFGSSTPVNGTGTRQQAAARVSSDVKRSPSKLRQIPGMQNFAKGRRSIVIDQITKKYKRIAEKKKRLS
nr:Serine threonine protein kinase-related domain containing protein [Haemonchus contortus]